MQTTQNAAVSGPLPVELTSFIGRERELASLRQLLGTSRLLTLTGAGGSGKSRLALELITTGAAAAPAAWVSLAPLTDPELIPAEILRSLGAAGEGGPTSVDAVIAAIGDDDVLLVLDNCEHLVEACAELADRLLRACPALRILATSREALGVAGERAWLVPPLGLVPADAPPGDLERADAVRLFADRARDVVPDFAISPANGAAVAEICARLDGIPLAIELAAARVRHMSPEQIRDRLSDVFTLLTTGARTALPRHRTLRAAIDWSYDLLPEDARAVLRRLSVFRGGFTLDAVEAVAAGAGVESAGVLDLVALLVDRSMVTMREQHGVARYALLETVRQYAAQRLHEAGEAAAVQRSATDYFAGLVAEAEPAFITPDRRAAFARLDPELDNLREVLAWTRAHDPPLHVSLVGRLWWFWYSTRHWPEAQRWIEGARALPEAARPTRERAALLFAAGALAALRALTESARADLRESAELAARLREDRLESYALNYLGMTYAQEARAETLEYSGHAERWFRENGDMYGLRLALLLMGTAEHATGNTDTGLQYTREAVAIARGFGQDRELGIALQMLGTALLDTGDMEGAERAQVEALQALRRDASPLFQGRALDLLGVARSGTRPAEAAYCFGAADAMRQNMGAKRFRMDEDRVARASEAIRQRLGGGEFERAYNRGAAVALSDAVDHVLTGVDSEPVAGETAAPSLPAGAAAGSQRDVVEPTEEQPKPDLRVLALGPFEVWVRGERVAAWPYARPRELLVHLLTAARGRTRHEIGSAIWPDATPAQLRNSFHVTMHHLRKSLGHADWIVLEEQRYRVSPEVSVLFDAVQFERDARAALTLQGDVQLAALRRALAWYRGHLLEGETAGAWRDEEQDRLRALYTEAALRLGALLEERGEVAQALALYEALVAAEPLLEEAHRRLMSGWLAAGDRARALRHYQRLMATLSQLELEPDAETEALMARIGAGG